MSLLHSLSCNWVWFTSRNEIFSDSSKAHEVMMKVLERAVNPSCNCTEQIAGLDMSVVKRLQKKTTTKKKNICHQMWTIGGIVCLLLTASRRKAFVWDWRIWRCMCANQSWPSKSNCVFACICIPCTFVCAYVCVFVLSVCGWGFLPSHSQTI